jgi:hypothetical protein
MNSIPAYDPRIPKGYYDSFGEKEWERLSGDCTGELLYHVDMDVLRCYVHKEASVLELGAGAGIFSKELVALAGQLVVSDILEFSKDPACLECGADLIYVVRRCQTPVTGKSRNLTFSSVVP